MDSDTLHDDPVNGAPWNILASGGPILATSIHAGHRIRKELDPWLVADEQTRLREEDPMTDYFLTAAGNVARANRSRFECDLNRSRDLCITSDPEKTWGLKIWSEELPEEQMEASRRLHDAFYAEIGAVIERMIARYGRILVLDLHSFNHMREGPDGDPAPQEGNPDIDLGVTELNHDIYGDLLNRFTETLRAEPVCGNTPDVRHNKRFPDGGHFPEWVYATYGDAVCTVTLEYKKFFMNEWGEQANILALQHLRGGVLRAVAGARADLAGLS